jgi:hypothetical protein
MQRDARCCAAGCVRRQLRRWSPHHRCLLRPHDMAHRLRPGARALHFPRDFLYLIVLPAPPFPPLPTRCASLLFAASQVTPFSFLLSCPPDPPHATPCQPPRAGVLGAAVQSAFSLFLLPDVNEAGESSAHAFAHGLCVAPPRPPTPAPGVHPPSHCPRNSYGFNGNLVGMGLGAAWAAQQVAPAPPHCPRRNLPRRRCQRRAARRPAQHALHHRRHEFRRASGRLFRGLLN